MELHFRSEGDSPEPPCRESWHRRVRDRPVWTHQAPPLPKNGATHVYRVNHTKNIQIIRFQKKCKYSNKWSLAYNQPASLVGTGEQSWGADCHLQGLGGLVGLLSTQRCPERCWQQKETNSFPREISHTVILHRSRLCLQLSPGSSPSSTSVTAPPSRLATYRAASISSPVCPFPFHKYRASGVFSTNTSFVFRAEAVGSTWVGETQTEGGFDVNRSLESVCLSTSIVVREADLNGPRGLGGGLADVEESFAARLTLAPLAARPTQVDDQKLVLEHAHEVRRFLALSDANLPRHSSS